MRNIAFTIIVLFLPRLLAASAIPEPQFFNEYCISCHGSEKQNGEIRLDQIDETFFSNTERLKTLIGVLEKREMPPRKKRQPPTELRAQIVETLKRKLLQQAVPSLIKRLTREEYTNRINDLFDTQFDLTVLLPEDRNEDGFNKLGESHRMSSYQVQSYLNAARFIADRLVLDEKPQQQEWVFGPTKLRGTDRGDYQTEKARVLATFYPWRSNLHFSTSDENDDLFRIPEFGRYRFEAEVTIVNSEEDQTIGINLGDPRYPTNFKKIKRLVLPNSATSFAVDLLLRKGSQIAFTFDSAKTWNAGNAPKEYKGPKLFFTEVRVTGPICEEWPTPAQKKIFAGVGSNVDDLTEHLITLLTRRELPAADVEGFKQLARNRMATGGGIKAAARTLITAILSSPYFLHKHEESKLDDLSLAFRLSYFLWNSAPDEALMEAAKTGSLRSKEALEKQVVRMLQNPKVDRFSEDFTRQWLLTDKIDDVSPDLRVYSRVTNLQMDAIAREPHAFFHEILSNNLSMVNFIDSDFMMVNDFSARFYGLKGISGTAFRPVKLSPDSERGGLVGQAGFLKLTSSAFETSPVQRGAWILKNIYGENIEPPANLKFEEPDVRGAKTVKEVMAKHQSVETCYRCHSRIDPLGLALERYDPIGRLRKEYRHVEVLSNANTKGTVKSTSSPIDSEATLVDGRKLNSMRSLKKVLMEDKEVILKSILSRLISYSMGRETGVQDEAFINEVYDQIEAEDFPLRSAILVITTHESFRRK